MKIKKILSVILSVLLVLCILPAQRTDAAQKYLFDFGGLWVSANEKLYEEHNLLGTLTDYDVHFKGNTLYVNTSKFLQIEPHANSKNIRIVFEHNANVAFTNLTIENSANAPAITVNKGKTVNLSVWGNSVIHSVNGSACTVKGTLNVSGGAVLSLMSDSGFAIDGGGTVNLNGANVTAEGAKGGICVLNFTACQKTILRAKGTVAGAVGIGTSGGSVMKSMTLDNARVTATGGEGSPGIGAVKGSLNTAKILGSCVTVSGGTGASADIGIADGGTMSSVVIDGRSTVKAAKINVPTLDPAGETITLHKLSNPSGETVFVDDYVFPYRDHNGEAAVYAFLKEGEHNVSYSEKITLGDFFIESNSPTFQPHDLKYDEAKKELTVCTSSSFIISNIDPEAPTDWHIVIPYNMSADIILNGVNISSDYSAIEIAHNNPADVHITLAEGSYNRLVTGGYCNAAIEKSSKEPAPSPYEDISGRKKFHLGTLTIDGDGTLFARSYTDASAIGAEDSMESDKIVIKGGIIIAQSAGNSPAINCKNLQVYSGVQLRCIEGEKAAKVISHTAKNENDRPVYPLVFENCTEAPVYLDGAETVFAPVSGENYTAFFTDSTDHCVENGDTVKYFRLSGDHFEEFTLGDTYYTGDFVITTGEPCRDYSYINGVLTVKAANPENAVTISNADPAKPTADTLTAAMDKSVYMILDGVNIDASEGDSAALSIPKNSKGDVHITLAENSVNILKGNKNVPAVYKPGGTGSGTLSIGGSGRLAVIGNGAAAIGARSEESFSHLYITGGTIELSAAGASHVIGIGGWAKISDIVFEHADITLRAENGSCIGGGIDTYIGNIELNSGNVRFIAPHGSLFFITQDFDTSNNTKRFSDIKIFGGAVTIDTARVFSSRYVATQIENFVIGEKASVLSTNAINYAPVNENGDAVYVCAIENPDGEEISIDGVLFPDTEHDAGKAVYPYLTGEEHSLLVGDTEYELVFDNESSSFVFRELHGHVFGTPWKYNETHHWHECTVENCWLVLPDMLNRLTANELTASGYEEHDHVDFVCECGHEDVAGCREHYKNRIKGFMISDPVSLEIRKNALAELETATSTAEIIECFERCSREIDAVIKELSTSVSEATDAINNALGEYKTLLTDGHGYDLSEVITIAENGIMCIRADISVDMITKDREKILLDLENAALDTARKNTTLTVQLAAATVAVPSDTVDKTVMTAKKSIANADTFEDIFDIEAWALEIIEALGAEVHEHSFSDIYSKNEASHWHAATCEHTFLVADMEGHSFGEGVVNGNKRTFTCTVCGYEKTKTIEPTDPTEPISVCERCGRTHADNFIGKLLCFFYRIANWFNSIF